MVLLRALGKLEQGVQHGCGVVGRWQRALLQSIRAGGSARALSICQMKGSKIRTYLRCFHRVARFENTRGPTSLLGSSSDADYVVEMARLGKWVTARLRLRSDT